MCPCTWWSPIFLLLFLLMDLPLVSAPLSTIMGGCWNACPGVSTLFSFSSPKLIRVCRWGPPACLSSGRLSVWYFTSQLQWLSLLYSGKFLLLLSDRRKPQVASKGCWMSLGVLSDRRKCGFWQFGDLPKMCMWRLGAREENWTSVIYTFHHGCSEQLNARSSRCARTTK